MAAEPPSLAAAKLAQRSTADAPLLGRKLMQCTLSVGTDHSRQINAVGVEDFVVAAVTQQHTA